MHKPDSHKPDSLASILRTLRESRGWSQTGAEAATGIPQETWSAWERGTLSDAIERLRTVAKTFGMSLGRLLGDETAPPPVKAGDYLLDMALYRKVVAKRIKEIPPGHTLQQQIPEEFAIVSAERYAKLAQELPPRLR